MPTGAAFTRCENESNAQWLERLDGPEAPCHMKRVAQAIIANEEKQG